MTGPKVAIVPHDRYDLASDVRAAGGDVVGPRDADAVVWVDPSDAAGLKEVLAASPARWVQLPFAGIEAFFAAGVIDRDHTWTCAKGIYGHSTAEHALTLLLAAARRIGDYARAQSWAPLGGERMLENATVVLVGTGGIGTALVAMLEPLGPRVIAVNRSGRPLEGAERTVAFEAFRDVVRAADYLVLAPALTPATKGLVDREVLDAMAQRAWIVNVGRGPLIVTNDLVAALERGAIAGAALDVTDPEPLPDGHPLWRLPNALITPHVANTWEEMALPALRAMVRRNVERFSAGVQLEGLVDPVAGY